MRNLPFFSNKPGLRRWCIFNFVGLLGIGVQLAALALLLRAGLHYLPATALAVEASVIHNFLWHERWTWADRSGSGVRESFLRLARFNVANGLISIAGNLLMMALFVDVAGIPALPANLLAIALTSVANYLASDRFVFKVAKFPTVPDSDHGKKVKITQGRTKFRFLPATAAMCVACLGSPLAGAELRKETAEAWNRYVRITQERIETELRSGAGFMARDFLVPAQTGSTPALRRGNILVTVMQTADALGGAVPVPGGMIHHWLGSVFIPNANLEMILAQVKRTGAKDHRQEDVLESRVLSRDTDSMRIYLKLIRSKIVTVAYNTEHLVEYRRHDASHASSRSTSLRIAELEHPNTPSEREKPVGIDSGFLWRLNSYWRYEQVPGGVIIECESISLSRDVPRVLSLLVRPIIGRIAKESMARTLAAMRERFSVDQRAALQ